MVINQKVLNINQKLEEFKKKIFFEFCHPKKKLFYFIKILKMREKNNLNLALMCVVIFVKKNFFHCLTIFFFWCLMLSMQLLVI